MTVCSRHRLKFQRKPCIIAKMSYFHVEEFDNNRNRQGKHHELYDARPTHAGSSGRCTFFISRSCISVAGTWGNRGFERLWFLA